MSDTKNQSLRFAGSIWCNLDIALRNLDQVYGQVIEPLARAVGRAATSFTPILDKLQNKDMIERRPDASDRRAVRIYLTKKGNSHRDQVMASAEQVDTRIRKSVSTGDFKGFQSVLANLQSMPIE